MTQLKTGVDLDIRPVTPLIGAEIRGVDLRRPLDEATRAAIYEAFLGWKVLFFRDQDITPEQQKAFAANFGEITQAHPSAKGLVDHPEIWERYASDYRDRDETDLSRPTVDPPREYYGWHIDITFVANPAKASILWGKVIPPYGRDTVWSNLVAAYEGLSPALQGFVDDLHAVHGGGRRGGYEQYQETERRKATGPQVAVHPLVRVHPETGEKALFVNPGTTSHIVGLRARESQKLLEVLVEEVTRPRYHVRFHWEPHSIAFWDNRVTAHVGPVDYEYFDFPRTVNRVTLAGDLPVGPDGFTSYPLEGELFS
jgi:taurine dioxygenase